MCSIAQHTFDPSSRHLLPSITQHTASFHIVYWVSNVKYTLPLTGANSYLGSILDSECSAVRKHVRVHIHVRIQPTQDITKTGAHPCRLHTSSSSLKECTNESNLPYSICMDIPCKYETVDCCNPIRFITAPMSNRIDSSTV